MIPLDALVARVGDLSRRLDQAVANLRDAIQAEGETERIYSMAKANAYLAATGTARERDAATDKVVSAERERAHVAAALTKAAFEEIRSLRQQMSALQTVASAQKAQSWATQPERSN